jgi:O-glycosyl hydrolase
VETSGKAKGVRVMTFQTSEGGYVAQVLNSLNETTDVNLESKGKTLHLSLPARSITTATW